MVGGRKKQESPGVDEEKWVYDSSVDHRGRVPLRASTGVWKASLFIIGIEFAERLSYFGIVTSLIIYLTKVLKQDLKTAASAVNIWNGVTTMLPLVGGYLADSCLGRFSAVLVSSVVYVVGLLLLTMSTTIPALKPCDSGICHKPRRIHKDIFFVAIYLISAGTGGHKPSLESFGADQFDDDHPGERKKKLSFFNWWNFGLCCGLVLGVTVIVYVQEHVGWAAADIILSVVMALTILVYCIGRPFYRFRKPVGSPFTPLLQVLVAAIANRNLQNPSDPDQLYEVPKSDKTRGRPLCHTDRLKFLDKAAIINPAGKRNPWRLATVTKVEETKLIINMIPIWLTTIPFGICVAQVPTFFIKQGSMLDRRITDSFTIPTASIYAMSAVGMIITVTIYDKALVPFLRKLTGNERGITILQRIGIGMTFSVLTMVVAALVEWRRLTVVDENPVEGSTSMSLFWLVPQFLIIGVGDGFALVGLQEYFYDEVPDSMRSLGIALYFSVLGAANFLSSLLLTVVDGVTKKAGRSWIGKDLNSSRLDYFYWLLAGIIAGNLCIYVLIARSYSYKNVRKTTLVAADCTQTVA